MVRGDCRPLAEVVGRVVSTTAAGRPARPRRRVAGVWLLAVPAATIVILLFVFPLVGLIGTSFRTVDGGFTLGWYHQALDPHQELFLTIIRRTAWIALIVTTACGVVGYAVAYAAISLPRRLGLLLIGVICLPFFTSALVRTFSWQVILANNGPLNHALIKLGLTDHPVTLVYNDIGVVIGMTQVLLPMMVFPIYSAMRSIDLNVVAAAESLGSSPFRAWRTTFLPLSMPGVAAGSALVFVVALGFYTTPALLQGASTPMFAPRMDALSSLPGTSGALAAQSTLVLLSSIVLLAVFRRQLGLVGAKRANAQGRSAPARTRSSMARTISGNVSGALHKGGLALDIAGALLRWPAVALLTTVALAMSIGPMIIVTMVGFSDGTFLVFPPAAYSTRWFSEYLHDPEWLGATATSLRISLLAALITVVAGAGAAFVIARSRRPTISTLGFAALVAPMVVPQIVLAVALLSQFINMRIQGTSTALTLGYLVVCLPLSVLLLTAAFRALDPVYERASASLGASAFQTARWVIAPLIAPALTGAALFSFVTAFSDLVMAQFLGGPQAQTLERLMFQDIREEVSPEIAAVGTLLLLLVIVLGLMATTAFLVAARRLRPAATGDDTRR